MAPTYHDRWRAVREMEGEAQGQAEDLTAPLTEAGNRVLVQFPLLYGACRAASSAFSRTKFASQRSSPS